MWVFGYVTSCFSERGNGVDMPILALWEKMDFVSHSRYDDYLGGMGMSYFDEFC